MRRRVVGVFNFGRKEIQEAICMTDVSRQFFECHQPKKDQDYVYSTYIP